MRSPAFWWRDGAPASALLAPLGAAYGAATAARMARPGRRAAVPVVCVGNLVAGGAGKTPLAAAIVERLQARGGLPVILSRGYGGALAGPVLVDRDRHGAADVGDEPLLLARQAPVVVCRDRRAGAELAVISGATTIVMDDGLQNPALAKDLSFAVVDGASGVGNGRCIPAGPLRAPLAAQWPFVHALVLVGEGAPGAAVAEKAAARGIPVLGARLQPDAGAAAALAGREVIAFAGIGRPEKFFDTLRQAGARVGVARAFPDHHPFADAELHALLAQAQAAGRSLVTTEKDAVRLPGWFRAEAGLSLSVLPVRMVFSDPAALDRLLESVPTRFALSRAMP